MAQKVVAMILAGGKGTRLKALTRKIAKPAVHFGGKYRIIDFSLSNVANSDITVCGVLTQYESAVLTNYVGNGSTWGFDGVNGKCQSLAPHQTEEGANWYNGTADAIYQNLDFLDDEDPDYVLILSGDHIYKTTYNDMIDLHIQSGAVCTISVIEVPWEEASRFGILEVNSDDEITKFVEKPKKPQSNLASMGIYVFSYKELRKALIEDAKDPNSNHDFGSNIIPTLLAQNKKLMAYRFSGYWRDVGTLDSLHAANVELLPSMGKEDVIHFSEFPTVFSEDTHSMPQFVGKNASIDDCLVNQGAIILGHISHSVISNEVYVGEDAEVVDSYIMPGAKIGKGAKVYKAIVGPNEVIKDGEVINQDMAEVVLEA